MEVTISKTGIVSTIERQNMWMQEIERKHILYFGCYTGLGKTSQAEFLAESNYSCWIRLHGESEALYTDFITWNQKQQEKKRLVIIDNLSYLLEQEEKKKQVIKIIEEKITIGGFDLILIGRAEIPGWLHTFRSAGLLKCYGVENFILSNEEVDKIIDYQLSSAAQALNTDAVRWLKKKKIEIRKFAYGVPFRVILSSELVKQSGDMDVNLHDQLISMVGNYYEERVVCKFSEETVLCVMKMAVFEEFNDIMTLEMLGESGFQIFSGIIEYSSFIVKNKDNSYRMNESFRAFMNDRFLSMDKRMYYNNLAVAAECCEKNKFYSKALELYELCNNKESLADLIIYMADHGDGCYFPRECNKYLDCFTEEEYEAYPQLLGARALVESFHMHIHTSNECMERLEQLVEEEKTKQIYGPAEQAYIATLFALPHRKSSEFSDIINRYVEMFIGENSNLSDFMVTGGGPSIINGSFDLVESLKHQPDLYDFLKQTIPVVIGKKGLGFADTALGEYYLETGNRLKAISYLIPAISVIRDTGNVKALYAANAIMARSFLADQKIYVAKDLLKSVYQTAQMSECPEICCNIKASQIELLLYEGISEPILEWMEEETKIGVGRPLSGDFYVSDRYRLFVLAKAYIATKHFINAAVIVHQLFVYAEKYDRKYLQVKLHLLNAIIAEAGGEDGTKELVKAVKKAVNYGYIRIIADEGTAIRSIWEKTDWSIFDAEEQMFIQKIKIALDEMTRYYPEYIKPQKDKILLSKKEEIVLGYLYAGDTNEQIAEKMNIKLTTAKFHVSNILKKIGVKNRQEAIKKAIESGFFVNK